MARSLVMVFLPGNPRHHLGQEHHHQRACHHPHRQRPLPLPLGLRCPLPPPFGDQLLLEPDETDTEPYGMFPDYKDSGITETAEMVNGRLAMIGLIALLGQSAISGQSMIDVVNTWVGGAYF